MVVLDKDQERKLCVVCGVRLVAVARKSVRGFKRYLKKCTRCGPHRHLFRGIPQGRKPFTEQQERGVCPVCNKNLVMKYYPPNRLGITRYQKTCAACSPTNRQKSYKWAKHKKDVCSECGFVPVHSRQLDIHHLDGNKKNNEVENLITICANCHRLKHIHQ